MPVFGFASRRIQRLSKEQQGKVDAATRRWAQFQKRLRKMRAK